MAELTPVVICLSRSGEATAHRVAAALGASVHGPEGRLDAADTTFANALEHIRTLFAARTPIIGVCAAGILIRAVAPLLADKRAEPPLIAVAEDGSAVVPLLGGHHGSNRPARRIAEVLETQAGGTTAGERAPGGARGEAPGGWRRATPGGATPGRGGPGPGRGVPGSRGGEWRPGRASPPTFLTWPNSRCGSFAC